MFRETGSGAFDTMRPYMNRAFQDDDVRKNVTRAFNAARKVYSELSGQDAVGVANKFSTKDDLREDLDTTVQSLSEALLRMSGNKPKNKSSWGPFFLLVIAAIVLFNPATGNSTRKWVKDHLFGSEEEFDYATPTY